MRNYNTMPVDDILKIGRTAIELLYEGFKNIGFRPKTNHRLDALEDIVVMQQKEIELLKEKLL